jgi:GTP-binding protein Era
MLDIAARAVADADVVVLLVDGTRAAPPIAPELAGSLRALGSNLLVAINKRDSAGDERLRSLQEWSRVTFGVEAVEISAEQGDGVEALRDDIAIRLPESDYLYPEDDVSSQTVRFFVAELIREAIFELYAQEIPYGAAVKVEEFREDDDPVFIRANVFVERNSQKGIVIGKGGEAIRELGKSARFRIESFLGRHVYLELRVKVLPKWRKDPFELARLGFPIPSNARTRHA